MKAKNANFSMNNKLINPIARLPGSHTMPEGIL